MTEFAIATPWGSSTFCDDLRQEVGGKYSLLGIYTGYLYVETFPISIPKFCIHVSYVESYGIEIPPLTLQIYLPGDEGDKPSISLALPAGHEKNVARPPESHFGEDPKVVLNLPIQLAPFLLKQSGQIKVRMKRGDDTVRMGMLYVDLAANAPNRDVQATR